jgi:hypothetical protein
VKFLSGPRLLERQALDRRSAAAAAIGWNRNRGRPVVVKIISTRHSRRDVKILIRYVARLDDGGDVEPGQSACRRGQAPDAAPTGQKVHPAAARPTSGPTVDRGTPPPQPVLFDERCEIVPRDQIVGRIDAWDLRTEVENLSRAARELLAQADSLGGPEIAMQLVADMPVRERLRNAQAVHIEMSLPLARDDWSARDVAALEVIAGATIRETFGSWGHRVLWGVHAEPGGVPHIHVVVKAVSEEGDRLRFPYDNLLVDGLRTVLAKHARALGYDVDDLRRGDRNDLMARVAAGTAQPGELPRRLAGRKSLAVRVAERAPSWFAVHGEELTARLARRNTDAPDATRVGEPAPAMSCVPGGAVAAKDAASTPCRDASSRPTAARPTPDGALGELSRWLGIWAVYHDAAATRRAVGRFDAMVRESPAFARWCLLHQPAVFAEPGPGAKGLAHNAAAKRMMRRLAVEWPDPTTRRRTKRAPEPEVAAGDGARPLSADERRAALLQISAERARLAQQLERAFAGDAVRAQRAARLRAHAAQLRKLATTSTVATAPTSKPAPTSSPPKTPVIRRPGRGRDEGR